MNNIKSLIVTLTVVAGCISWASALKVSSVSPKSLNLSVPRSSEITVTFDAPVDPESVN